MLEDKEKTKKLLEGVVEGENINIINLNELFQKNGVLVDVHVGRMRCKVPMSPEAFGLDIKNKSKDVEGFLKTHLNSGYLSILTPKQNNSFNSVECSLRQKKKKLSIGFNDRFLTLDTYKEFKQDIKVAVNKYNHIRDSILADWSNLLRKFENDFDNYLNSLDIQNKELIKRKVMSKIPSKEQFKKSCFLRVEISAFPIAKNIPILDDDISEEMKETIYRQGTKMVEEVIGSSLSLAFDKFNKLFATYSKNRKISGAQLESLQTLKQSLIKKNLLKNPKIDEIISITDSAINSLNDDEVAELLENAMINIYKYAKSVDIDMYLDLKNSVIPQETLEIYAQNFNDNSDEKLA